MTFRSNSQSQGHISGYDDNMDKLRKPKMILKQYGFFFLIKIIFF